ncbi:tetratricopeptide repeat protein [Acetobacter sp. LMG 32666]|uniref:tetratricopeptide repeat protein n=1 Tax=Acetobacter sp. LMG 32666 TaxID=2959295 RepID=UPI0030C85811
MADSRQADRRAGASGARSRRMPGPAMRGVGAGAWPLAGQAGGGCARAVQAHTALARTVLDRAVPVWGVLGRAMLASAVLCALGPGVRAAPLRASNTAPPAVQDVARSDGLHALPVTGVQADALPGVADVAPGLFLPADSTTALAAFWSGPELMVVVDRALPALFHLPGEGGMFDRRESVALNGATLLRLYLPDHPHIVVVRQKAGWLLCVAHSSGCGAAADKAARGGAAHATAGSAGAPGGAQAGHAAGAPAGAPSGPPVVRLVAQPARVLFAQAQPGRIVTLPDPATGGRLFVATTRQVEAPLQPRSAVGYAVRPAVLGVVVAADSAQLFLQPTPSGPVLEAIAAQPVPVGLPAPPPSASVRQGQDWFWLGLRDEPTSQLLQKWRKARDSLGQAGGDPTTVLAGQPEAVVITMWAMRVAAAQAAFAAGYPQQAWDLLRDLPVQAAGHDGGVGAYLGGMVHGGWPGPGVQALRACAALLSGDLVGAAPLASADWAFGPDMVLWRGAYFMLSGADSHPTSVLLARGYARLEQYPAPVRANLMLRVTRYLAQFGGPDERAVMGTLPDDADYNLARIMVQARSADADTARVALENLTASGNDRMADRARAELVGFLQAHDQIGPDMAAQAYAQLLAAQVAEGGRADPAFGQGGADLVPMLRLAYAQALAQAGQAVRAAGVLSGLGVSEQVPQDRLDAAWRTVLFGLVFGPPHTGDGAGVGGRAAHTGKGAAAHGGHGKGRGGPPPATADMERAQQLALARASMGQVPDDPVKAKLLAGLGRQLMALGQFAQAIPVLQQADVLAIEPLLRADIEEQLAQAALQSNQRPLALRALERSALADLPADLAARRRYDEARLAAASGNREGAQALLAEDESDEGLSVRGALYEQDQQWEQAVLVVGRLASRTLPEEGELSPAQRDLVIRLATDATAAGDAQTMRSLRAWVGARSLGAERQARFAALLRQVQKAPVVSLGVVGVPTVFDKSVKDPK